MSFLKDNFVINDDIIENWPTFKCDKCGEEMCCSWPRYTKQPTENIDYCGDCAFKLGIISGRYLIKHFYYSLNYKGNERVAIYNNKIYISNKKFPWEKTEKEIRKSKEYLAWRKKIFQRDNYVCRLCNKKGGVLNAHHIKPFKQYPNLRFDINNGITLCIICHRREHGFEKR